MCQLTCVVSPGLTHLGWYGESTINEFVVVCRLKSGVTKLIL